MRWMLAATSLATMMVAGACGTTVTPSPSPTTATPTDRVQTFYARADEPPLPVPLEIKAGMTIDQRVQARFTWLAAASWFGPGSSFNVLRETARVGAVAIQGNLANLDFTVSEDGWGVHDSATLRAFLEQVVYTATDEKSISRVKLTQNGGEDAQIATSSAIVTYSSPLTREIVTPFARQDHTVAYFARDLDLPVAVFLPGAGIGATPEERIRSRLVAPTSSPGQR